MDMPFKFFIRPIGKGKFLELQNTIDRTIKVSDVIQIFKEKEKMPEWCKNISDFKNQAISSLIFHSQIVNSGNEFREEFDILDYVFDEELPENYFLIYSFTTS